MTDEIKKEETSIIEKIPAEIQPPVWDKSERRKSPPITQTKKEEKYLCPSCQDEIEYMELHLFYKKGNFITECNTCFHSTYLRTKDKMYLKDRIDRFLQNQ